METYIQITKLNDYGFCPHSIYLHSVYESFEDSTYKDIPQQRGKIHHESIDTATYSSATRYLQGISIFSSELGVGGKIDIYDSKTKTLVDRKYKIKQIFQGYKRQLYAQYYCLREMGYEINHIKLHSLSDNKRYTLELPNQNDFDDLKTVIYKLQTYDPTQGPEIVIPQKCATCIYKELCTYAQLP